MRIDSMPNIQGEFWLQEVTLLKLIMLGHDISVDSINQGRGNDEVVRPILATKVRSFLGFTGYYRRFIRTSF